MIYGSNEKGEAILTLSASEHEAFKSRKEVSKVVGCSKGEFRITVKMTRCKAQPDWSKAK